MDHREYTFDNLKCFLIILVVVGHCISDYCDVSDCLKSAFCFIYFLHMPGFIFTAGLFCKKAVSDAGKTKERIFYFLSLFLLLDVYITVLRSVLLSDPSFSLLTIGGIAWFMVAMASFYGMTRIVRDFNPRFVLFLTVTLGCLVGYDYTIGEFLSLSRIIVYYPLFFLGYMIDPGKIAEFTGRTWFRVIGALSLAGYAWLCFCRLDLVMSIKPLFSGKNSFEHLPVPAWGAAYRLVYYLLITYFILCMIAVVPRRKTFFTVIGQRTLQIYFFHYGAIYLLHVSRVFDHLSARLPEGIWAAGFLVCGLLITLVFALPVWKYPFDFIGRMTKIKGK